MVKESTAGEPAELDINQLPEFGTTMRVEVNEKKVDLPKFASVNGQLQSGYYSIQENDSIEILNYYTVRQIAEFMDVLLEEGMKVQVNNKMADLDTRVYENFSVVIESMSAQPETELDMMTQPENEEEEQAQEPLQQEQGAASQKTDAVEEKKPEKATSIMVRVNGLPVRLSGKPEYVFVDVFDHIDFDLSKPEGKAVVTRLNGREAQYMEKITEGDVLDIFWRK